MPVAFFVEVFPHPLSLRDIPLEGDMPLAAFAAPGWLHGSCPSDTRTLRHGAEAPC